MATTAAAAATFGERAGRRLHQRLAIGHAVWWIPNPKSRPRPSPAPRPRNVENVAQKLSFGAALKDLLQNFSFHCYGKLVEHGYRNHERFFWLIFHITALSVLIAFVWNTYKDETEVLVTTIYNPQYPVSEVDLPAVSVCSMNRISKRAVRYYAQQLSDKDHRHRNASFFYRELRAFGMYYGSEEYCDYQHVIGLQRFLDDKDTEPYELFFNTRRHLHDLTPNCSDMFVSCRLAGQAFDCLTQFRESLTNYGFCCTFNLRGRFFKPRPYSQRFFGADMGLTLTLKSDRNDNYYKMHKLVEGFAIIIYEPENYPDPQSGGVSLRFVSSGRITQLPVIPRIIETVPEARHMSPQVRNCFFEDEIPHNFSQRYTFSKCISACRARSIFSLCGCLPFNIPMSFIPFAIGRVFCTLQHMECLQRYKFKWLNVITTREFMPGLEHELEDALYCPDCLASCSEIRYKVRGAMSLPLKGNFKPMTLILCSNSNYRNNNNNNNSSSFDANNSYSSHDSSELAVVRIYFAETHIQYFRQIIKNAWYEIFSTIGNICGIIAGFSLIGICELLFFLAKQLWHAYKAELKAELCQSQSQSQSKARSRTRIRANGRAKATQQQQQQQQPRREQQQEHELELELEPMELLILP
ncbi:sodium channel protein Nach [Drosophila sulfurigaster albostrigata]|uniref:sodium channel protein Nach n=1 Tax=Drosophila sulfurigaster albostrigata TaxID=89887 RepID=UPI002D218446|nr:sodium channel protein Nach [Drosophila sulfurigaster albostrigata]